MKKSALLLVFLLLTGMISLFAQDIQVKGTVTSSEDGSSVPGAYVMIKGTQSGVATDVEGNFTITVPADATLVFSSVGMKSQEIAVGGQTVLNVVLDPDIIGMEEVIVVGYTTVRRETNTGSVGLVSNDQIKDLPETSLDKMLTGKVPGLMITSTTGQPGANSEVRIRGTSSINAGNQPLYVVDGIPVMEGDQSIFTNTSNALAIINPSDIESISVLKDAAAASIYGSRAANGVILVTTKSGKQGKSRINFKTSFGFDKLANDNNYGPMNAQQLVTYLRDAATNSGLDPDGIAPLSLLDLKQVNWIDEMTKKGKINTYELSVEGGNEKTTHYLSGAYTQNEGIFYGVDYKKYQLRANVDHKVSNLLKVGSRITLGYTDANDVAMQALYFVNPIFSGMALLPWTPVRNPDGTYNLDIPEWFDTNPLASAEYDDQWEKQNRLIGNVYFELTPLKGLTLKSTNSYEYTGGEGRRYWSPEADPTVDLGTLQTSNTRYRQITTSNTVDYRRLINKHSMQFILGQEATDYYFNYYYLSSPDVDPKIPFPTTSTSADDDGDYDESAYTLLSFFGVGYYNFDNRYFLQASLRRDGSSRFGKNNRWGNFWSVGASWNIHNEKFMQQYNFVDLLKIRGSYGISGNYNIGDYEQFGLYGSGEYNSKTIIFPSQPENPDLTWELNSEYNLAFEFGFLNKISGSIEIYDRRTSDMLLNYPLSRTSGFTSITRNIGEISNKGYELLINGNILERPKLKWDVTLNFAHNRSEILDLGKDEQITGFEGTAQISGLVHKKGERLYSYYLYDYAGVNPTNGEALWYNKDGELTNQFSEARQIIAGSPEPKYTGGFSTTASWNGLALDLVLEFKAGNKVLIRENRYVNSDGAAVFFGKNQANTMLDYWKKPGDITSNPKPLAGNNTNSNTFFSTRWMEDGDYLRIKNITLSYTLPASIVNKIRFDNIRIYTSAINLYTFHNVRFWDPERGVLGLGTGIYPMTKKFVVGLDITL
jgi:TonB-linked SusC/RagA family outer membrane protein